MADLTDPGRRIHATHGFTPALVAVLVLLLGAVAVGQLSGSTAQRMQLADFPAVAGITFTVVGALVVPRQPHNRIGWLCLAVGLSSALALLGASFSSYRPMAWLYTWAPAVAYGLLPLLLLHFPDGQLPSRSWRPVVWGAVVAMATAVGGLAVTAWADSTLLVDLRAPADPPLSLVLARVGLVGILLTTIAAALSLIARGRRATGDTRQQLKWLGLGAAFIPVGIVAQAALVPGAWLIPATTTCSSTARWSTRPCR